MTPKHMALSVAATLLLESVSVAGSCKIENAGAPDDWRFVHVYDVDLNEVVLRQAIKSGDSIEVTVSGERVRVDHKFPGGTNYLTGPVAVCKDGDTVKF